MEHTLLGIHSPPSHHPTAETREEHKEPSRAQEDLEESREL